MNPCRYENSQPIPDNVIHALMFTGKVGFITRSLWHEFFATGNIRWQERQLQKLIEAGYLKKHRNAYAKRVLILTEKSVALVTALQGRTVSPVPVMYLAHDTVVARSLLILKREQIIRDFTVERELKTYGIKDYLLSEKDHDRKYPDAVFKFKPFGKERTVAVEYEREQKSGSRYQTMLTQYAAVTNLDLVLFIVERSAIKKAIEGAKKYLGQNAVSEKLAFVTSDEWQKSPLDAVIEMPFGEYKISKMCSPRASN